MFLSTNAYSFRDSQNGLETWAIDFELIAEEHCGWTGNGLVDFNGFY